MGWKEFLASVAGSVSWPLVVLILGILFRKQLVQLLQRLQAFKLPGAEATFAAGLDRVEVRLAGVQATEDEAVAKQVREDSKTEEKTGLEERALTDPTGTVIRSYQDLSNTLHNLRNKIYPDARRTSSMQVVLAQLSNAGLVSGLYTEAVLELMGLRSRVAHGMETISPESALIFARTAEELRLLVNAMAKVRGRKDAEDGQPES